MDKSYKILKYTLKFNNSNNQEKRDIYQKKINEYSQIQMGGKKSIFKLPKFKVGDNVRWNYYGVEMLGTVISKSKHDKYKVLTVDNTIIKVSEILLNKFVITKLQKFRVGDTVSWNLFNNQQTGIVIGNLDEQHNYKIMLNDGNIIDIHEILLQSKKQYLIKNFSIGEKVKFKLFNIEHYGKIVAILDDSTYSVMKDDGLIITLDEYLLEKLLSFNHHKFSIGEHVQAVYLKNIYNGILMSNKDYHNNHKIQTNNGPIITVNEKYIYKAPSNLDNLDQIVTTNIINPQIYNTSDNSSQNTNTQNPDIDLCHSIRPKYNYPIFYTGNRVFEICLKKNGTIKSLRDDAYEKEQRKNGGDYHYNVDFDDGSFDTYVAQKYLQKI
jgi:hypothetical protein